MEFSKRMQLFGDEIFAALNEKKVALEAAGRNDLQSERGYPRLCPRSPHHGGAGQRRPGSRNWKYSLRDLPEMLDAVCSYYKRAVRGGDLSLPGGQLQRQSGGLRPHRDGAVRRGGHRPAAQPLLPRFHCRGQAGRRRALLLSPGQRARFPALCGRHPRGCSPPGQIYDRLPARQPCGQRGHPELYAEIVAFAKKYDILINPRQRLQRHHL